ncbi:acylphosphatase (plasmid) [Methanocaldococcus sp. 28A]
MNNISPNNINTSLNISSKYSNVEINPILKANIKALLEFLKAKFNNSIDLEKAEKFAYNRGLIDEKGHLTEKGMEILTVLFRLFPDIDFTNSDVIKSIDIDSILRKLETLSQNSTSGNECCQQEPTVANFETEYKSFANFEKDVPTFANFENKMPIVANNELAKVGIANNELAKVGIANNTMINMTNMDDVLCVILNKFDILKEDIRKLANEIRKEKKISKTFGKSSFYDIMKWLLTDKCVDTRYIAENIKNLNASLGSYKADLAYLNKIGWIYEDLDGLYKLNVEKFLSDLERAGLINKLHYERELENASYNEIWDLDQKYYSLNVDENGVFKFEFGDKTLEQYYLSSMILNETKVLINRLQKEYFKNWRKENLKEIVDCEDDTLLFPLIKCHFTNIPISATECIQYPDPSKVGKLVVVEAEILEATPIKNIVICGEYSEYLDDDEPHIEYFDLNTKKIPETIKIKTEDGVKELKLIRKYIHTVQEFLLQQPIDELNPKEEPKPIKGVWIGAEGLFDIGAKVRIVGILDIDKSDRPISPYVIRILTYEIIIYGRVQHVGFRDRIENIGRGLGISGIIYNYKDGTVRILANFDSERKKKLFKEFIKELEDVDNLIKIERIEERELNTYIEFPEGINRISADDLIELNKKLDEGVKYIKFIFGELEEHKKILIEIKDTLYEIKEILKNNSNAQK